MPSSHQYYDKENRYDAAAYKNWAKTIGEDVYLFICRIIAKYQFEEQSYKSCNGILHLCKDVPKTFANKAAKECIEANVITYSGFKSLLNQLKNERLTNQSHLPEHSNLRGKDEYK